MLVLLIIFMVAAPMAVPSIKIDLPKTSLDHKADSDPVFIDMARDGGVYIGPRRIALEQLGAEVNAMVGHQDKDHTRIMIRGDGAMNYQSLMRVINRLQDSGHYRVALVSEKV